jgi:UDP-hydrolysing UDP-N-acetyl-D-glucosamine 2-epimerase
MLEESENRGTNFYFFALSRADFWLIYPLAEEFSRRQLGTTTLVVSSLGGSDELPTFSPELKVHKVLKDTNLSSSSPSEIFQALIHQLTTNIDFTQNSKAFLLGDRYETVGVSMVLNLLNIPFAHISGGESTPNSQDDLYRKCVSILATVHFPPLLEHARALVQLGIDGKTIFSVGYLGWDSADSSRGISEEYLKLTETFQTVLFTYHPNTMDLQRVLQEVEILLEGLELILAGSPTAFVLITASNHDFGGNVINNAFEAWTLNNSRSRFVEQLGEQYLAVMEKCQLVMGNSSSGIVEAPRVGTRTLNIGDRQHGRGNSPTVTHARLLPEEISSLALQLLSQKEVSSESQELRLEPLVRNKIIDQVIVLLENGKF